MRNLVPYVVSRLETSEISPLPLVKLAFSGQNVVACFCGSGMAAVSQWSPARSWFDTVEWALDSDTFGGNEESVTVVGLDYYSMDTPQSGNGSESGGVVVVAFSNGDFVEVKDGAAQVVGSMEMPLASFERSPTGDVWLIATQAESLDSAEEPGEPRQSVVMIDPMFRETVGEEHVLSAADMQLADKHVSVGWGKRETQFQGRGARALSRDPTVASQEIESHDADPRVDSRAITASWRGDGEYVVVNSCVNGQRALRVFTNEGILDSVSEPASRLASLCAYEPRGALIATVQLGSTATESAKILFFERNGLKRYSFDLNRPGEDVKQLAWSVDSSVLAVVYADCVDLWTQKNWHWYRKQRIAGEFDGGAVWHPELPRTLALYSRLGGHIVFSTWHFATASDEGLVAVIDKNAVKVTPLDVAGVPPPMAFAELDFGGSQPQHVAVFSGERSRNVTVALADEIVVAELDVDAASLVITQRLDLAGTQLLTFASQGQIIAYIPQSNEIVDATSGAVLARPPAPVSLLRSQYYMCGTQVFSLESGEIVADFHEPCTDIVVTPAESFGLTRSGKLVHSPSGRTIQQGVTSILAGPQHLMYTTNTTLRFVHYNITASSSVVATEPTTNAESEQSREIERGSVLITVMSKHMAVVLQAPRGNIETIYPRMLLLGVVRASVAQLDYAAAFKACKTHRLDMNILYDLDPEQWKQHIDEFVTQLGSDANVDLFLSSLSNEDVTVTKYRDTSKVNEFSQQPPNQIEGKANDVLDFAVAHVSPPCQITALAMKQPPALVEALEKASASPELVKHLVFLSDPDVLYRTALSVYKPRLALVVAQQAQMDPKEYLPFLRARDSESEPRSRFNIDVFLRRFETAAAHLIEDTETATADEIIDFVLKHDLHVPALRALDQAAASSAGSSSIERNETARASIMRSQAEKWLAEGRYVDAGTNYEILGDTKQACDAYVLGCCWKRALALPSYGGEAQSQLVQRLVDVCEASKLYADSAHLLLYFLNDPRRALELYCQADRFDDAVLVAARHDGLQDVLGDQLRESFGTFQELLTDFAAQVPAQLKRLRAIRAKRSEDMLGFDKLANQLETQATLDDTLSLAGTEASGTTNASAYTRYTDKSSVGTAATNATRRTLKNQRRQERKRARGKKGSVYEEDYLIASTTRLVDRLRSTRPELRELITALRRCKLNVYATQLVAGYEKVLALLVAHLDEIFTVDDEVLVRFDQSGNEYMAERPTKPELPSSLEV